MCNYVVYILYSFTHFFVALSTVCAINGRPIVVLRSADLVTQTAKPIDEALAEIHDPFRKGDDKQKNTGR